jgi:hypothetical protein
LRRNPIPDAVLFTSTLAANVLAPALVPDQMKHATFVGDQLMTGDLGSVLADTHRQVSWC